MGLLSKRGTLLNPQASTVDVAVAATAAAAATALEATLRRRSGRKQVATRCQSCTNAQTPPTPYSGSFRTQHLIVEDCWDLVVAWGNVGINAQGANAFTLAVGIDIPGGASTPYPVTFGGQRSFSLKPGAIVLSDPIPLRIAAGTTIYVKPYHQVNAGEVWPIAAGDYLYSTRNEGTNYNTTGADLSGYGSAIPAGANIFGPFPLAILGRVAEGSTKPAVGIFGDSISIGTSDNFWIGVNTGGYPVRAMIRDGLAYINYGLGGDRTSKLDILNLATRFGALEGLTSGLCEYGINDVVQGLPLATMQANFIAFWRFVAARGLKLWQTTTTPYTTSTDAYATVVNQTPVNVANENRRTSWNDWVRDGAPLLSTTFAPQLTGSQGANVIRAGAVGHPLAGYFETADLAESGRNSGKWLPLYTADGLHPLPVGAIALSAGINTALLA